MGTMYNTSISHEISYIYPATTKFYIVYSVAVWQGVTPHTHLSYKRMSSIRLGYAQNPGAGDCDTSHQTPVTFFSGVLFL